MEKIKAKHTVGDPIHVKFYYADERACLIYYGGVTGVRLHDGSLFPDQILYDVYLKQADAPHIRISNLPKGFVMAGGPEKEDEEDSAEQTSLLPALGEMLKPEES